MKRLIRVAIIGAISLALTGPILAKSKHPDATLSLRGGSVAAGLGISWGSGTLTYKGKAYPVSVNGLSVGDAGITKIEAKGNVYSLKKLDDFDGNYTAVGAGATVAGGGSAVLMRNQNGVEVELLATTKGLKLTLGGGGVDMKIKK